MGVVDWEIKRIPLSELRPWANNPRKISREAFEKLKSRIQARGFHDILKVDTDGTVLSGNQRLRALKDFGVQAVACKVAPHKLTDNERAIIALESNKNDGEDDWDELANFDLSVLKEGGFTEGEIKFNLNFKEIPPKNVPNRLYQLLIECSSEEDLKTTYENLKGEYKCRVLTL